LHNCICGHSEEEHEAHKLSMMNLGGVHWCRGCSIENRFSPPNMFHDFKLDNLSYIEDLAKKKGLI